MSNSIAEQNFIADSPKSRTDSPVGSTRMAGSHQHHQNSRQPEMVEDMSIDNLPSSSPNEGAELLVVAKIENRDDDVMIIPDEELTPLARKDKGKGKAVEVDEAIKVQSQSVTTHSNLPENLLSSYSCPICFSTVTNACLTPCGHVLCGLCLFSAVRSSIKRGLELGIPPGREGTTARCPVCRATLKGWDGKGGGVIPLKVRTITAL